MRLAGAWMFTKAYINRFCGAFSTKIQRPNTLKVEYAIEMQIPFRKVDLGGKNTSKFTQVHCWTLNHGFSRSRQHMDDEPSMCSSVQLAFVTSGIVRRRPIRRRCLRFLFTVGKTAIICWPPRRVTAFQVVRTSFLGPRDYLSASLLFMSLLFFRPRLNILISLPFLVKIILVLFFLKKEFITVSCGFVHVFCAV